MKTHYKRLPDGATPGTYQTPDDGWVCFHCGVRFLNTYAAEKHFGKVPGEITGCRKPDNQMKPTERHQNEKPNIPG